MIIQKNREIMWFRGNWSRTMPLWSVSSPHTIIPESILNRPSTKDARINELEQWTHQLEDAKAYLEQKSEAKDKRISELEQWCQEVTDGKAYVENQWNAEKENRREDAEKLEKLSQKLALLLGDEKIQKIIAKRKYQI